MKKKILTLVIMLLAVSTSALADDLYLGDPIVRGTGCPSDTVSATLSPDGKQLSILFDNYFVEAGGNGRRFDRKSCNVAIPVHVPQGYSVSIFQVDYRGYTNVPRRGYGRFNVEYFFAGRRGPRMSKRFRGGTENDFTFTNRLAAHALVWSACGADVNLRTNSSMFIRTNRRYDDAYASVDSLDIDSGIVYHIQWRSCY